MGLELGRAFADRRLGLVLRARVRYLGDGDLLRLRRIGNGERRSGRGMGEWDRLLPVRV